ncbi:MAG TPA: hypothetical protein VEW47_00715 [Candidatus Dormibacteraeota bacterium]|nr:hypothetical protein [Candidatus Dormibacteraeota bacterium]
MARRNRQKGAILSTTPSAGETDLQEAPETTALAVRSSAGPLDAGTQFTPATETAVTNAGKESVGRTAYDLLYPFTSNPRYLYLLIPLVVGLGFGTTGHLTTWIDGAAAGGVTLLCWIVLFLVQWKR